ncbi:MAG: extracellular solute-binding protein, partial [Oscillospiraceae bacterium]|nr:extracellular solute-binding protein [Oscillospiraceae bacterium]
GGKLQTVRKTPATAAEKKELVWAADSSTSEFKQIAADFNATNSEYSIRLKEYNDIQKLLVEIIAGEIPDMLSLSGSGFDVFASKGLFEPLDSYIDADRIELVPSVRTALSTNGVLYRITPDFTIETLAGNRDYAGENAGWTYEELLEAFEKLPDGATIFTKGSLGVSYIDVMAFFVGSNLSPFVDWSTGTVRFDSDEFKSMLEFVKKATVPGTLPKYSTLMTGESLVAWDTLFRFYNYVEWSNRMDGKLIFKGYPSPGRNMGVIMPDFEISITSACEDKEGAWSFLRYVLTEFKAVDPFLGNLQGFYFVQSRYDEQVREAMSDDNAVPMTEEQYKIFSELLENSKTTTLRDTTIIDILNEETAPYFAEQKTIDEVCKIIQSRVQIYVNEQK